MRGPGFVHTGLKKLQDDGPISLARATYNHVYDTVQPRFERSVTPKIVHARHRLEYGTSAPERDALIHIDPMDIESVLVPPFFKRLSAYTTHIIGGEWDQLVEQKPVYLSNWRERSNFNTPVCIPADEYVFLQSARQHFQEGVPWEDTEIYDWLQKNKELLWYYYNSPDRIDETLAEVNALYDDMKENGYRTQRELYDADNGVFAPTEEWPPELDEVMVSIGRDGTIIFDEGRHRWVIARVAGIESMPVRVLVRHQAWQRKRRSVAQADTLSDLSDELVRYVSHPDMQDVRPEGLGPR